MNIAAVKIWNKLVGAVTWNENLQVAEFEYDKDFKKYQWDLSPLKMPLNSAKNIYTFPELSRDSNQTFKGLPGLLADSLPDRFGNDLINIWLAQNGRPPDSLNPLEALCFVGKRGMGALEFEPVNPAQYDISFSIEIDSLVDLAQRLLNDKKSFTVKMNKNEKNALVEILKIGTSAGGARPKAVIAYNEKTGEVKSGQTTCDLGFNHWLIKLDGVSDVQLGSSKGYGRVEMAYYKMALDCGIEMMESRLLEENDRAHFMTRRFDRGEAGIKHHVQTFCALNHFDFNLVNNFSYEQLFNTMRQLRLSYSDAEQMFRRMVFNVIARNCDDHTKNFSFIMSKDESWKLAPAYDICHAYRPGSPWVSQHALSINGKRKDIAKDDLLAIAKSVGCKNVTSIIDDIISKVKNWKKYADEQSVNPSLRDAIYQTLLLNLP